MQVIATQLKDNQIEDLKQFFLGMDADASGAKGAELGGGWRTVYAPFTRVELHEYTIHISETNSIYTLLRIFSF